MSILTLTGGDAYRRNGHLPLIKDNNNSSAHADRRSFAVCAEELDLRGSGCFNALLGTVVHGPRFTYQLRGNKPRTGSSRPRAAQIPGLDCGQSKSGVLKQASPLLTCQSAQRLFRCGSSVRIGPLHGSRQMLNSAGTVSLPRQH